MAAAELRAFRYQFCLCLFVQSMNAEKLLRGRACVDTVVRGIQTARGDECACLNRNNFDTQNRFFSDYIALASSAAYLVRIVLVFQFYVF